MKPWECIIKKPEDLKPFADCLEEDGHPGVEIVHFLIEKRKFPLLNSMTPQTWMWHSGHTTSYSSEMVLPEGALVKGVHMYDTPAEAIWAIINHEIYKEQIKWYDLSGKTKRDKLRGPD